MQNGMIDVYARVNYSNDACPADSKTVLRIQETNDLRRRLGGITVPDGGAVVIHRSGVVQTRRNVSERRLRDGQEVINLHTDDAEQGLHQIEGAVQQISEEVVGRCYEKGLANLAVQAALHLASKEVAKIEDRGQAAGGADDVAVLGSSRL